MPQTQPVQQASDPGRKGLALYFSLPIFSWAMYDFANTIFSSNITTIFFPFYIQKAMGGDAVLNQLATTFISYTNVLASVLLVILSPLFGVLIDRTGQKKRYLVPFALISILCTLIMGAATYWQTEQSIMGLPLSIALVLVAFMLAKLFYQSSLIFYDSMITDLGSKQEIPLISGFGVAVGYLGTLMGLAVYPFIGGDRFGLAFLLTGLLYLVFCIPMMVLYKEPARRGNPNTSDGPGTSASHASLTTSHSDALPTSPASVAKPSFFSGYKEIAQTFREIRQYQSLFYFMIAYFFFNDAVATAIAMMAVYAKVVVHFSTGQFIALYLVSTVCSIIGSFVFGHITKRIGAKRAITWVAIVMITAIAIAVGTVNEAMFWVAGALYGVSMGSMWVTSRTLIAQMTPDDKRGQFFGLFAFSGKVSAIVGPLLYGSVTWLLADYGNIASRAALGSLAFLTIIGLVFHKKVQFEK
ncbi:MFS transporter [Brevibacillus dissolubilis]|uniref:MFS transporter n=1 Tax=Brevibacillus dissolubilis TaxID=1844116 RepID=UPI0011170712|nr:MFS transporter [Brevibacillus dissolubilis]